jgi:glycosyltransferase involved in cell wall biosynthesis
MKTAIIIPALNPDYRLAELVSRIRRISDAAVVVVNDGSSAGHRALFALLEDGKNCIVARHSRNLGKGAALKTGIRLALECYPGLTGFVTADADGQHRAEDIVRLSNDLRLHPGSIILGTRDLTAPQVPFKSRWGNRITSGVFRLCSGVGCPDTQTGLRAFPVGLTEFLLSVPGERYEYEMNVLLAAAREHIPLVMLPVSTVYFGDNRSSHFRAVRDSALIYGNILGSLLRFSLSSLTCAAADVTLFTLFTGEAAFSGSPEGILAATVTARCLSGVLNFTLNKKWSFGSQGGGSRQAAMYGALFLAQMLLSFSLVTLLSALPVNLTLIKMFTDCLLFTGSYYVQKNLIFKAGAARRADI